ncbi:MAG: response regulator [Methylotetracoccus sp.]
MSSPCVLIIDDQEIAREILAALLSQENYRLEYASSGSEGVRRAKELQPDLILLDVMMPNMNGFEACRLIRADADIADIPVVMITALDDPDSRLEGIDSGADDFLAKPFNAAELRARVRTTVRLNRYRKLCEAKTRFAELTALLPHGVLLVDSHSVIRFANEAIVRLLGFDEDRQLIGRDFMSFIASDHADYPRACLGALQFDPLACRNVDTMLIARDGRTFPATIDGVQHRWEGATMSQLLVRDTTDQTAYLRALEQQAYFARLTDVANLKTIHRMEGLSRQLLATQEFERRALARELHDEIGQQLGALKLHLRVLGRGVNDAKLTARLTDCLEIVDSTIVSIRNRALELRPSMLDDLGLKAAVDWYCSRQAERSGAHFDVAVASLRERLPTELETACFRIVQESVNNALRHGQANSVTVVIRVRGGRIKLAIRDDGLGFDARRVLAASGLGSGFGLLSMRERSMLLGGRFGIRSAPGRGTLISSSMPLVATRSGDGLDT